MAYSREEKENLEVSYPINAIWEAIPKAIAKLEWKIQETNEEAHHLKVKTKGAFMSYPSTLKIDLAAVNEKTTRMIIVAETPVTTITSVADYGRTRERTEQFVTTLAKLMSG
ncbi:MAG: hypothetical protein ABSB10_09470 [Candidatus Bathyarchaeia archaeon]|jgi:uncharacterized lipoprotein